jgi:hypothetical protein
MQAALHRGKQICLILLIKANHKTSNKSGIKNLNWNMFQLEQNW